MKWMPFGWTIKTEGRIKPKEWRYECTANGLPFIKGPRPGETFKNERAARKAAVSALRYHAWNQSASGWSKTGVCHAQGIHSAISFCNPMLRLDGAPDLRGKESPMCAKCGRILDWLEYIFADKP